MILPMVKMNGEGIPELMAILVQEWLDLFFAQTGMIFPQLPNEGQDAGICHRSAHLLGAGGVRHRCI
jgi:hypothetical protein